MEKIDSALVTVTRPDGIRVVLRVPAEHMQRVMDLANGEFGDPSIDLGGPTPKE